MRVWRISIRTFRGGGTRFRNMYGTVQSMGNAEDRGLCQQIENATKVVWWELPKKLK